MGLFSPGVAQGVVSGMEAYDVAQIRKQQVLKQQQDAKDAALQRDLDAQQRARDQQARENFGTGIGMSPPPIAPPMGGQPGQSSAPPPQQPPQSPNGGMGGMQQPPPMMPPPQQQAPGMGAMPPQAPPMGGMQQPPPIPKYQTVQNATQPPAPAQGGMAMGAPPPIQPQQPPTDPTEIASQGMLQTFIGNLQKANVPQDQWYDAVKAYLPVMTEQDRSQLQSMKVQMDATKAANQLYESILRNGVQQQNADTNVVKAQTQSKNVDSQVQTRKAELPIKQENADSRRIAANRPRGSGSGGGSPGSNMGHVTAVERQRDSQLKPITDAERQSEEIRGLLSSDDPAATSQVQKILGQYIQSGRMSNQQYGDNKSFGNVYQRAKNSLDRYFAGEITPENKKMISDMLDQMDDKVFEPARKNVNKRFDTELKHFGFDEAPVENAYSSPASAPKLTNADGWKLHTDKNGVQAYVSPDGKQFKEVK